MSEASRDTRGTAALDALTRDTRHGLRRLVRDWRFTTAAVLILGLAIGATTVIFSVVNAVLFRDPPFADPNRLVDIYQNDRAGSYAQSGLQPTTVIARASGDAAGLVGAMQRELRAVDVTLPVMTAQTMAQDLELSQAAPAAVATFLSALSGLGLVLASIGLYAVVAFAVARRSREIGIRMALGARSQQVVWSIARGVAGLIGVGTGIGLVFTVLAMLALRTSSGSADIGIGNMDVYRPTIDPVALLAIAAVTAVVGVAAAFVPGRRAALMDPLVALRHE